MATDGFSRSLRQALSLATARALAREASEVEASDLWLALLCTESQAALLFAAAGGEVPAAANDENVSVSRRIPYARSLCIALTRARADAQALHDETVGTAHAAVAISAVVLSKIPNGAAIVANMRQLIHGDATWRDEV